MFLLSISTHTVHRSPPLFLCAWRWFCRNLQWCSADVQWWWWCCLWTWSWVLFESVHLFSCRHWMWLRQALRTCCFSSTEHEPNTTVVFDPLRTLGMCLRHQCRVSSPTKNIKQSLTDLTDSAKSDSYRAYQTSSSVLKLKGSMFYLIDPLKMKGVWGMTDTCCLKECSPILLASYSPNKYSDPGYDSQILNTDWMIDDLPAPVLPTIPTFSPGRILNETFFNTKGSPSLYLIETFLNSRLAFSGQLSYTLLLTCYPRRSFSSC